MPEETLTTEDVGGTTEVTPPTTPANGPSQDLAALSARLDTVAEAVMSLSQVVAQQEEGNTIVGMGDAPVFYGGFTGYDQVQLALDALINGVRQKLFPLGDHYVVYPGHGPVTTIGHERQYNPFF